MSVHRVAPAVFACRAAGEGGCIAPDQIVAERCALELALALNELLEPSALALLRWRELVAPPLEGVGPGAKFQT